MSSESTLDAAPIASTLSEPASRPPGDGPLHRLLDNLPAAAFTCDADGLITYFNARAAELWGRAPRLDDPADRFCGSLRMFAPDGTPMAHDQCSMALALRAGKDFNGVEVLIERPGGQCLTVLANINPVRDEEGRVLGAVNVLVDITQRKRAEDMTGFLASVSAALGEITDYESTLQRIARLAVPMFADWCGVTVRDDGGAFRRVAVHHQDADKVLLVEELFRRYPPHPDDSYGAMSVLRTGEPAFVPQVTDEILAAVARDAGHLELLRSIGMRGYLCVPMRSHERILGAITFAMAESGRDFTEHNLSAAEDIASRAAIAIENAELLQAMKEADRRKDEFLAMLAHELRNPLAPVRNAVHILRRRSHSAAEAQWAQDVIERQVQQMSRLVDDLLDVSRIASGKIGLRCERTALAAVVATAIETTRPLIERSRHELKVLMAPQPILVEADVSRLSQVVSNLLTNAAKYTDPGGRISVAVSREGDKAVIRVKDTGMGIPASMLHRIFDMFTQVARTAEHAQGGLGIGLTLVKRLVELHGGTVEALSAGAGQGSEFVVRLPMIIEADDELASPEYPAGAAAPVTAPRKILVVDDNKDAADSLAFLLQAHGNHVKVAYDGLEGVGAAVAFAPDIVLLDIGLPKLYGYDVARRIRESRGNRVLIIAITGWGQSEDRSRSREAGIDHHFTKPVDLEALMKLIAETAPA